MAQSQILWDNYPKYCVGFVPSPADDLEYLYHDKAGNLKPYNQHKFWGSGCFSPTIPHEDPKMIDPKISKILITTAKEALPKRLKLPKYLL